jgi:hypothetical protein
LPEVVPVLKPGELAVSGPAAEALEDAEGDVLLVGGAADGPAEPGAGQHDELLEVRLPELLGGVGVALLEPVQEAGDGPFRSHRSAWRVVPEVGGLDWMSTKSIEVANRVVERHGSRSGRIDRSPSRGVDQTA